METARKHSNGLGYLHGGFIMSFIDMAMFAFIFRQLENSAVGEGETGRAWAG